MNLEDIAGFFGKLYGLPGFILVLLFCVGAIKALRSVRGFPNDGIWLAAMLIGCVLNSLIADPMADNYSLRVWLAKNAVIGGIIGFVAVLGYNRIAKRISQDAESKMDFLGRNRDETDSP